MLRSKNWWHLRRRPGRPATLELALPGPDETAAPLVKIAPNDSLIAYLQSVAGAVDLESLKLDSPALAELRADGIRMVVPLVSQGELIGLLNLGARRSDQAYSADDRKLLNDLAGHAAPAVRVAQLAHQQQEEVRERERIEHELRVAQLIQQQFLPRELPDLPGWHLAAHYRPAREVGGDFYDFIELPRGQLGIVVGDVTDKGVPAALVMAMTHAVLRAEAPRLEAPAAVLERANDLLVGEMPAHMFVTCLYAVLDPTSGRLRFANAGHNLPYLRGEDQVRELRATGMPLGLLPDMRYEERATTLDPGDGLLLHSDGLAEAHGPDGEMFGLPRLASLVGDRSGGEELISLLLAELSAFTAPGWEQEDDITLVTLQRTGGPAANDEQVLARFEIPSEPGSERLVVERVLEAVEPLDLPHARLEQLRTAVAEATMNAVEHGNANRAEVPVEILVLAGAGDLMVRITDHGGGRPIPEPEQPDLEAKLAGTQSPRGWGLFLIKHMVDELRTSGDDRHHTVELVMHLEKGAAYGR